MGDVVCPLRGRLRYGDGGRLSVANALRRRGGRGPRDPVTTHMPGDPITRTSYPLYCSPAPGRRRAPSRARRSSSDPFCRAGKARFTYRERAGDERRMIEVRARTAGKVAVRLRTASLRALSLPL